MLEPVLFTLGGMTMRKAGKSLSEPLPLRSCIAIMETSAKVGELLGASATASSAPPWRATMTGCGGAPQGLVRRRSPPPPPAGERPCRMHTGQFTGSPLRRAAAGEGVGQAKHCGVARDPGGRVQPVRPTLASSRLWDCAATGASLQVAAAPPPTGGSSGVGSWQQRLPPVAGQACCPLLQQSSLKCSGIFFGCSGS
eukprot:COSAG01_NODE_8467_length_2775_cov_8.384529_1_plen_197_part_00